MRRALLIACALILGACDLEIGGTRISAGPEREAAAPMPPPSDLPRFFNCLREHGLTAVSAHRGGPIADLVENSIPTFENTVRSAPGTFLEVDISQTRDGVLVLMHDDRAERTTTGSGAITELDMEQLLAFRLEDERGNAVDARVPTLREALDWAGGRAVLELDIKRGVRFEDVIDEVREADAMSRVLFITYSVDAAARLAHLAPQAMIYTTISSVRELDVLERRNVDLNRIVAWLGTDTPDPALVRELATRGVEARAGLFGYSRDYAGALRSGVQIVAVDDAHHARSEIDAADGDRGFGPERCLTP